MLATYRIPLLDARRFVADAAVFEAVKLPEPWDGRSFIRGMGKVEPRRAGAVAPWSYETAFANLQRTLTFPPGAVQRLSRQTDHSRIHSIRKRAWRGLDRSTALLDVDLSLQINPVGLGGLTYPRNAQFALEEVIGFVKAGAALPVRLRSEEHTLFTLGNPLAKFYAQQTSLERASDGLVRAGHITAVVEAPGLTAKIPDKMRTEQVDGSHIQLASFDTKVLGRGNLRVHVLWGDRGTKGDRARIRELRIHILRLHSIYELMRFLASPAASLPDLPFADTQGLAGFDHLQRTLLGCVRAVRRRDAIGGAPLSAVLNAAFFSRHFMGRDLQSMLNQSLDAMRPHVRDEVKLLIDEEDCRAVENLAAEERRNQLAAQTIIINNIKGDHMGDKYKIGKNTGPVGPGSTVNGANGSNAQMIGSVTGNGSQLGGVITAETVTISNREFQREDLLTDLVKLHEHFSASNDRRGLKVAKKLSEAGESIEQGDSKKLIEALKKTGTWIADTTGQIGTGLAQAAIQAAIGIS